MIKLPPIQQYDPVTAPCPWCGVRPGHAVGVKCLKLKKIHHYSDGSVERVELVEENAPVVPKEPEVVEEVPQIHLDEHP